MQPVEFEKIVLKILMTDIVARDKIMPFLDGKLFDDFNHKEIVKCILSFESKFSKFPTISDMKLQISNEQVYTQVNEIVNMSLAEYSTQSLMSKVEDFFKKKLIWNVTAEIADSLKEDKINKIAMSPELLRQALAFSFDNSVGFNLLKDIDRFYDFMHTTDKIIPTGLSNLDNLIGGGLHTKTLTVLLAQCVAKNTKIRIRIKKR